jgi:hypothetical protein
MDNLSATDHKNRLMNLAALWQTAKQDAANLIAEAEAKAKALEEDTASAFHNAVHAAEDAFLAVKHDVESGIVRVFHLVEVDPVP